MNFKTSVYGADNLPIVIEPQNELKTRPFFQELLAQIHDSHDFFREKLLSHGAILLRGFQVQNYSELESFAEAFSGKQLINYAGGTSPRNRLESKVYTSTEYPANMTLALHNELSYTTKYPSHLYFCCLLPAENGGETTLGDSRRILKRIPPEFVTLFKQRGLKYVRNLQSGKGSGYSWQDAFETCDKTVVENICREIGCEFRWKENGFLQLIQNRPATVVHPVTGEEVWFNQADGFHPGALDGETYNELISLMPEEDFRLNVYFGDGSPIDVSILNEIRRVIREETIPVRWQQGDLLVVDNLLAAHGRFPFSGERKIILAMT